MRALRRAVAVAGLSALIAGGLVALTEQPASAATTWYLAATGGNNGNGCTAPATPCATLPGVLAKPTFLDGDTILLRGGTHLMNTALTRATITKTVTLAPENNPAFPLPVVFNGNNAFLGTAILTINAPGKTVTMSDITITNGLNSVAGGLTLTAGTVNATNVTWSNLVGLPGGISVAPAATYNQTGGAFNNNTAGASPGTGGNGGAVLIEGKASAAGAPGTASFTNVTFQSNRALGSNTANRGNGGAVYNSGALTLNGATFAANGVTQSSVAGNRRGYGGSIFNGPTDADDAPTLTISGTGATFAGAAPATSISTAPCPTTGSCLLHATLGGAVANVGVIAPAATGTTPGAVSGGPVNISGAQSLEGGGIYSTGSLTLTGGTITNNRAVPFTGIALSGSGGGIFSTGSMSLTGMSITTNEARTESATLATGLGGGVFQNAPGSATITNTDLTGNQTLSQGVATTGTLSALGGGLFNGGPTSTVTGGNIRGNGATAGTAAVTGNGGGIWNQGGLTVTGTMIEANNKAIGSAADNTGRGAGIFSGNGATSLTVTGGATVDGNTTTAGTGANSGNGGGIWSEATLTVDGSTVSNNTATASATTATGLGGGIFTQTGAATVTNGSTISGNKSQGSNTASTGLGGGLYLSTGTATVASTTVSGNQAIGGSGATSGLGGGLFNLLGTLTLNGPTVTGNTASRTTTVSTSGIGGGLYNFFGVTNANAGLFQDNTAVAGGGVANGNVANLHDIDVDDNHAVAGGGIYNVGALTLDTNASVTNNDAWSGGGIVNSGTLSATNVVLSDNTATAAIAGTGLGGGLFNSGTATLTLSQVEDNRALFLAGTSITGLGGGVFNAGAAPDGGKLTLDRTTLSGNQATGATGDFQTGWGGAVYNGSNAANSSAQLVAERSTFEGNTAVAASVVIGYSPGASGSSKTSIRRSTVSGNSTTTAGGAWYVGSTGASLSVVESTVTGNGSGLAQNGSSTANVSGSILFGNGTANCSTGAPAAITSGGHNLTNVGDLSCGFSGATNDVFADPQLGALSGSNGGPTDTHLPGPSSPALDKIPTASATSVNDAVSGNAISLCPAGGTDQRGTTLPQGAKCDIGSVEAGQIAPDLTGPTPISFTVGTASEVTGYVATGSPTPTLSAVGLPSGLMLVSTGPGTAKITGTPAVGTGGVHNVTITATNEAGTDDLAVALTVNEKPTVNGPTTIHLIETIDGAAANYTSTGFPTPVLSLSSGSLPSGVTFVAGPDGTATIDGAPAAGTSGTYNVTITGTNTAGTGSLNVTIEVVPLLTITTTSLPGGQHGVVYSQTVSAIGGTTPYEFSLVGGSLPAGLMLDADGTISGIPSGAPGTSTFTVEATDSSTPQQTDTQELSITITRGPTVLTVDPVLIQIGPLGIRIGIVQATLRGGLPLQPIAGQTVVFKAGATTVCTAVTNANGFATCNPGVAGTLQLILAGGVNASYAGNAVWLPSTGSAGLIG